MTRTAGDKTSLEIKRFINAPPARVYAAWADPAQLKKWWGPEGVQTRNFVADVRVGGKYQWDLLNQEGEEMTVHGEYRELVPGRKIVFTWAWYDDEAWENRTSVVTIELSGQDGGTELRDSRTIAERSVARSSQRRMEQRARSTAKISVMLT